MPPPMPVTMRDTGKKATPTAKGKPVRARYFPGKAPGEEQPESEEEEEDEEEGDGKGALKMTEKTDADSYEDVLLDAESKAPRIQTVPNDKLARAPFLPLDIDQSSEGEFETDEGSEGSESESEEEAPRRVMPPPVFLSKNQRSTQATGETAVDPQELRKAESRKRIEEQVRAEAIRQEQEALAQDDGQAEVDDTDDLDPVAEEQAWRLRELQRIQRDREAIEAREAERAEIERRQAMPEDVRLAEDLKRVQDEQAERMASRAKMGFMQKYYHKGAFYQEELGDRDFTAPVESEAVDKMAMPKMMQVRNLDDVGKKGRTKYTHLADQDTSTGDGAWQAHGNKRLLSQMGGMKDELDQRKRRQG